MFLFEAFIPLMNVGPFLSDHLFDAIQIIPHVRKPVAIPFWSCNVAIPVVLVGSCGCKHFDDCVVQCRIPMIALMPTDMAWCPVAAKAHIWQTIFTLGAKNILVPLPVCCSCRVDVSLQGFTRESSSVRTVGRADMAKFVIALVSHVGQAILLSLWAEYISVPSALF